MSSDNISPLYIPPHRRQTTSSSTQTTSPSRDNAYPWLETNMPHRGRLAQYDRRDRADTPAPSSVDIQSRRSPDVPRRSRSFEHEHMEPPPRSSEGIRHVEPMDWHHPGASEQRDGSSNQALALLHSTPANVEFECTAGRLR